MVASGNRSSAEWRKVSYAEVKELGNDGCRISPSLSESYLIPWYYFKHSPSTFLFANTPCFNWKYLGTFGPCCVSLHLQRESHPTARKHFALMHHLQLTAGHCWLFWSVTMLAVEWNQGIQSKRSFGSGSFPPTVSSEHKSM